MLLEELEVSAAAIWDTFAGGVRGRGSIGTCLVYLHTEGTR